MRGRLGLVLVGVSLALLGGCGADAAEEYPEPDEVPVTAPQAGTPGAAPAGTDTLLDPVTSPPAPGATPP